jgi:thiamine biosynthesis lipoprotein
MTTWQGRTMGSSYVVKIVGANLAPDRVEALRVEVEERLQEVNRQMSHYQPDSEVSRFNRGPAEVPCKVAPEFARVVRFSMELNRRSGGAFDPTLGPLIALWGFGERPSLERVPPESEIRAAMARTGCRHVRWTAGDELVKDIPDLALNLSSAAKGCGVDEMVRVLTSHGLTNVYAAIAGDVRVLGHNPRGTNWQVGITAPVEHWREGDPMVAVASLSDCAISTSGDYQKFFVDAQGRRLCHIFDPRTGWPVQHAVGSVSVVASTSMEASALATTLFVLGEAEGLKLIESWTNAAALFVVREPDGRFRQVPSSRFGRLAGSLP